MKRNEKRFSHPESTQAARVTRLQPCPRGRQRRPSTWWCWHYDPGATVVLQWPLMVLGHYDPAMAPDGTPGGEVGAEQANSLVDAGALLLDVREDYEWGAGHVAGAVHIPLGQLAARAHELPGDRQVVVVCRSGARSARATAFLAISGFDAVNLAGGMQAWAAAGLRFQTADGGPGVVA
jgi:rhodanese-related sulfurtransferase